MSNSQRIAHFAAGIAAGTYTEETVRQLVGGNDDMMTEILAMAGGLAGGTVVAAVASEVIDTAVEHVPGVRETFDVVDDAIDAINPFSDDWW